MASRFRCHARLEETAKGGRRGQQEARGMIFTASNTGVSNEGRPKPQSSVSIVAGQGGVEGVKSCARKVCASAAQKMRKVTVLKGFMH